MNKAHGAETHLDDGDVVRLLDREVSQEERWAIDEHLSECDACARRVKVLRSQSEAASIYLGRIPAGAPVDELARARALAAARRASGSARGARRWAVPPAALRAAAAAGVLVLGIATVAPLRAWVVDRWEALVSAEPVARVEVDRPRPAPNGGSLVSFRPAGEVFTVRFDHPQHVGSLTVQRHPGDLASAQIIEGGGETMVVLPNGLRVENRAGSTADYLLVLPSGVLRLELVTGEDGLESISLEGTPDGWTRTVPLGAPR